METRKKIMESAFIHFAKRGTDFSLTSIADEVGIKKASIYAHFENKEALLKEVIEKEIGEYFFDINKENDNLERIFFSVLEYYNGSEYKLLFWKRLLLIPPENMDPLILKQIEDMSNKRFEIVKDLIENSKKDKNYKIKSSDEIALMFFSLLHGLLSSVLIYHPKEVKNYYTDIWNLFNDGIIDNNA